MALYICYHYLISKNGFIIHGRDIDIISSPHNKIDNPKITIVKNNPDGIISLCLLGNFEEEIEHTHFVVSYKFFMILQNIPHYLLEKYFKNDVLNN